MKPLPPIGYALSWGTAFLLTLGACSPKATSVATTSTTPSPTAEAAPPRQ
ncbi:hypothetical protein MUN84_10490 [Hymenobacter sp. 5516J-16]|nr:hypothetical protein [Hymenobacter sp. 5516J-16]UOQ78911.1 hypothetical protein MUN84_10490 [Hymenobacter sp. 5516J-16]